jgi:excisionase family DNA binding protein
MTLTEAAASLGVTAATLRQQIANGKLRAAKRGRDWAVTAREVERYRLKSRRPSRGSTGRPTR